MRDIIKAILASDVPVIGYTAPSGARAASAGTYIMYACHVAAMAPATNIGAASPVSLTGRGGVPATASSSSGKSAGGESTEMRKVTNDAVAYIRALAERRGRNAAWAEKAVREAVSVSDSQALKLHVIDLIAPNLAQLLVDVDGRTVQTADGDVVLHTRGARTEIISPGWRSQFLDVVANPEVAYILLLIGLGGLVMEGMHPGGVLPGVVGAICLLLALYAFQLLPVNFAGLGLILLGVILIISEAFVPAYGVLGIGGVVSFVIGSVILMHTGVPGYQIALPVVIGAAIAAAAVIAGIVWLAMRSRKRPVVSGREQMVGAIGEVVADFEGRGVVHVHGERWQARSDVPLTRGQSVAVTGMHGLVLEVKPVTPSKEVAL
jgi:membrane-bound serine protease (ClpP class)